MTLTEKERTLVKDLKDQESLCIEKYGKYAGEASDEQLRTLFGGIASMEREHLRTLDGIESGKTPSTSTGSSSGSSLPQSFTKAPTGTDAKTDAFLCSDLLSTEKHASHLYDTCVFEFQDPAVRQALNHIQKEEQNHGKLLYDYMKVNGMYGS
ncbi:MAG: spore coat protein [Clostridiales bacterium]|nr:spore coat protein [Clostridiales bacterium]